MTRPRLYKQNGLWICECNNIKSTGATPMEAFLNFFLHRASENLNED